GKTVLKYTGDLQIGGALASVGQRMLDGVSKSMIRQGFEAFDKVLAERLAAKSEGREVKYDETKATEGQYAKSVVKGIWSSLTSSQEGRLILYIIPVVLVVYLLAKLLN
ncbi:MAG: SRPBCC domain-containing protein, partial [Anaerolineaceae bacterium]|nr:SRPBCC domain-containing protein [Anaerolineaceae bacterium]